MDKKVFANLLFIIAIYSIILLFIGRQLTFLPVFGGDKKIAASDLKKSVLEKYLKNEKGSFSIYYKNLNTGDEFGVDENKVQTAASLNKLPIVSYLYSEAGKGRVDLEDQIVIQKADIQDYGTGSIRYDGTGKSYSLKTLTKLALEQSDNTAAHVLGLRLGRDQIQEYTENLGLVATHIENNQTSAKDMGIILDAIWRGKVTNTPLKLELLDFMTNTDFEDRLAGNIKGAKIHHKAADGVGFVHDVGIIEDGKNAFIISVLVSEVSDINHAKETIGKIAEFIYEEQQR